MRNVDNPYCDKVFYENLVKQLRSEITNLKREVEELKRSPSQEASFNCFECNCTIAAEFEGESPPFPVCMACGSAGY
jgi:hypothetical protein